MGTGLVLDVEPQVVGMSFLQGQEVILPIVAADPDGQAVGVDGQDVLSRFFLLPIFIMAADEVHLFHFGLDVRDFIFRRRVFQGIFEGVEIV